MPLVSSTGVLGLAPGQNSVVRVGGGLPSTHRHVCPGRWEGNHNNSLMYSHVHLPPALGDHTNPIAEAGNQAEEALPQAEGGNQLAGTRAVVHHSEGRVLGVAESNQVLLEESGRHWVRLPGVVMADTACNCSVHHRDHGSHKGHHEAPHLQTLFLVGSHTNTHVSLLEQKKYFHAPI